MQRWEGVFQAALKPWGMESAAALPSPAAVHMATLCELGKGASPGRQRRSPRSLRAVHNLCNSPSGPGTVWLSFIRPYFLKRGDRVCLLRANPLPLRGVTCDGFWEGHVTQAFGEEVPSLGWFAGSGGHLSLELSSHQPVALGETLLEHEANTEKRTAEKLRGRDSILISTLQDLVLEHSSHKH